MDNSNQTVADENRKIRLIIIKTVVVTVVIMLGLFYVLTAPYRAQFEQKKTEVLAASSPAPAPKVVEKKTDEQWTAAFKSTFAESDLKKVGDGETSSTGCFLAENDKCTNELIVKRDAFRKRYFIQNKERTIDIDNDVKLKPYLSIADGSVPTFFIKISYIADDWLFMESITFLINGVVAVEHDFDRNKVNRDTWSGGVIYEEMHLVLPTEKMDRLRAIKPSDEVLVRVTGKEGYTNMKKKKIETFVGDFHRVDYAHSKIIKAVS